MLLTAACLFLSFVPQKHSERLLSGPGCGRGYVDSIVEMEGRRFHLLYRAFINDTTTGCRSRIYTELAEVKGSPEAYNSIVDYCKKNTDIDFHPNNIVLYTTDSTLKPIVVGDYSSVVGISIWKKSKGKDVHYGYVLKNSEYLNLGVQKLELDKEGRLTLWDMVHFLAVVQKYHNDANAYFIIDSQKSFK
ncbi:MAG: hypothetical protein H6551_07400 [Chitinophagales bacterium]|nr:hypothetical protein [Chitinophagaceae bacterium]MCB9064955.1 hypothetical protein [Chitinophagales bacterium]